MKTVTIELMRPVLPLVLVVAGIILLVFGYLYGLVFAGIPDQDPTPMEAASHAFHFQVSSVIVLLGLGAVGVGCVVFFVRLVAGRLRSSVAS